MSRPAGAVSAQEASHFQFGCGRQGTSGAGSDEEAGRDRRYAGSPKLSSWLWQEGTAFAGSPEYVGRGRHLRRKTGAFMLSLASWKPQSQVVMCMPAAADVAQEARRIHVGSGKLGTADASSLQQAGSGRLLRSKPDAIKLSMAGMEPPAKAVINRPAGPGVAQEARNIQADSGRQGTAFLDRNEQCGSCRHLRRKPDAFILSLGSWELQTQAVISRQVGSIVA
jgi:hypothetical protein